MRPTKYFTKWSARDRVLAEGLLEYERSLNSHGVPWHIASDPDRQWTLDESIDHASAAYEEALEEFKTGDTTPAPGLRLSLIDKGVPDEVSYDSAQPD